MPTTPQWVASYTQTVSPVITLTFTDTTTKALTLPLGVGPPPWPPLTLWNDRTGAPATDLLAWVAVEMSGEDAEVWDDLEPAGDYLGRPQLVCDHPRADGKTLLKVEFTSGLQAADLGFEFSSMPAVITGGGDYAITGAWIRGRLWIPQASSFMALDEVTREETVVVTTSPDGTNTKDYYGGLDIRTTELLTVPAAIVWPQYADDPLFTAAVSGMTAGDLNAPLDIFRQAWRDQTGPIRFSPDLTAPGTYVELEAVDPWIGNLTTVAIPIGLSPRLYNARLTALEV